MPLEAELDRLIDRYWDEARGDYAQITHWRRVLSTEAETLSGRDWVYIAVLILKRHPELNVFSIQLGGSAEVEMWQCDRCHYSNSDVKMFLGWRCRS